jgi:hypothetical protein
VGGPAYYESCLWPHCSEEAGANNMATFHMRVHVRITNELMVQSPSLSQRVAWTTVCQLPQTSLTNDLLMILQAQLVSFNCSLCEYEFYVTVLNKHHGI